VTRFFVHCSFFGGTFSVILCFTYLVIQWLVLLVFIGFHFTGFSPVFGFPFPVYHWFLAVVSLLINGFRLSFHCVSLVFVSLFITASRVLFHCVFTGFWFSFMHGRMIHSARSRPGSTVQMGIGQFESRRTPEGHPGMSSTPPKKSRSQSARSVN
jgi:hypothetical protein